jgi:hypothetical protein
MNCPKCQTPAAAGATHCKRCGSPLSAKAAAAPSSSDEIDLMPLEPAKPSYSAYEPPPGVGSVAPTAPPEKGATKSRTKGPPDPTAPPPPPDDYVPKLRGANSGPAQSKLTLIIGSVVGVIVVGIVLWSLLRTKTEFFGKAKFEQMVPLGGGMVKLENFNVTGMYSYTFDVEVTDGELLVGVVQRSHKDPQKLADLKKCDGLESLKKGDKKQFTGELKHKEQYSWMLLNDTKKPAKSKVKFVATPQ